MGEPLTWDGGRGVSTGGGDPRRMYGHPLLQAPTGWGVHWAGTETEAMSGHVNGAVAAGERVAKEIAAAAAAGTAGTGLQMKTAAGGGGDEL